MPFLLRHGKRFPQALHRGAGAVPDAADAALQPTRRHGEAEFRRRCATAPCASCAPTYSRWPSSRARRSGSPSASSSPAARSPWRRPPSTSTTATTSGRRRPDAYERLLLDALLGDQTLFLRADEIEASWRYADEVRSGWDGPHDAAAARVPGRELGTARGERALLRLRRELVAWLRACGSSAATTRSLAAAALLSPTRSRRRSRTRPRLAISGGSAVRSARPLSREKLAAAWARRAPDLGRRALRAAVERPGVQPRRAYRSGALDAQAPPVLALPLFLDGESGAAAVAARRGGELDEELRGRARRPAARHGRGRPRGLALRRAAARDGRVAHIVGTARSRPRSASRSRARSWGRRRDRPARGRLRETRAALPPARRRRNAAGPRDSRTSPS